MSKPIATAPKDGSRVFVSDGANIAKTRWAGMWVYDVPDPDYIEQIDFTPTLWSESPEAFL